MLVPRPVDNGYGDWAGPAPESDVGSAQAVWLPVGSPVQYYSRSQKDWIPARVMGHKKSQGYYELDVQPMAAFQRVRPLTPGTTVYYYSTSQAGWIPAVVWGFDSQKCVYFTDVQSAAKPWMIRERAEPGLPDGNIGNDLPAQVAGPHSQTRAGRPEQDDRAHGAQVERQLRPDSFEFLQNLVPSLPSEDAPEIAQRRTERRFKCPLCLEEAETEQGVSLDCYHKLCAECFGDYCRSKIAEGRVMENELVCPATDKNMKICGRTITVEQVRGNVAAELFDKFCMFRAANWKPSEEDGKLLHCPTPGCAAFMVSPDLEAVTCPQCRKDLCTRCGQAVHKGESCAAAAERLRKAAPEGERQLEDLIAAQGWMRCPTCQTPTELARGCYFMQCQSDKCRGRVHFCYLCGELLKEEDHRVGRSLQHFPRGPYNAECVNVSEEEYQERMKSFEGAPPGDDQNPVVALVEEARRYLEF